MLILIRMKQFLLLLLFVLLGFGVQAQCVTNVDFNTWQASGNPNYGNWVVQGGGSQVRQTVNATGPGFFISPFPLMNVKITGNFRTTDDDDDWMGFAFSMLNPLTQTTDSFDCWFFDWKQVTQGAGQRGMSLCRADGVIPPSAYQSTFWDHINSSAFTVVQNNWGSAGWQRNYNHAFELQLTYTTARIFIDGVLKFEEQNCFKPGRFGFYCISQQDVYYSNFQYDLFIDFSFVNDKICLGDTAKIQFVNPCITDASALSQYQSARWDFGDGSPPIIINNPTIATVNQAHLYTQPGNYNVSLTITDFNGCTSTKTNPIEVRQPISITPSGTPPPCNGGSNGSVTVAATGGYGNYQYIWNGNQYGQTYAGVTAGTYNVVVSDGVCAAATANYVLSQPSALSATTSHVDANCNTNNGSVSMTISGGTPPYQNLTWAGVAAPGGTRTGLGAGTYIANFVDANACSALLQYSETVNMLPCGISSSVNKTNVSCFGGSNGTVSLNVTGATGTPTITWTPGGYTGANVTGLAAGTYTYNFSDANPAHAFSGTVTITQPGAAMVASLSTIGISCAGANDGQALASVTSGGNPPYSYAWSGGHPNNPSATNLGPGPINVTITDANTCTATASGTISNSPTLVATMVTVIDSCFHSGKGSATVQVNGGVPPYTYAWNNLASDTINAGIFAGSYTVTITDGNGCTLTSTAVVGGPSASVVAPNTKQDIACAGTASGSITVTASGGTGPYTYAWNPNTISGANPTGLAAGIYQYTVTDNYGCSITGDDTLLEPLAPLSVTSTHTNVTCSGAANGSITVTISGGTAPYTYMSNTIPMAGSFTQNNVPAGIYTGTLTDANGCTATVSDTITEPAAQSLTLTKTDVSCNGGNNGSATANFVNATGAVTYTWNPGGVQNGNYTGLIAGPYAVTATDANSCTVTGTITVNEPPAIQVQETHTNVSCFGFTDGSINLTVTSATGPYTYTWSPNVSTTNTASNIGSGPYSITVTDASACSVTTSVVVTQPFAAVSDSLVVQDVSCFGLTDGRITVYTTGGTGAYTYTWSPSVSSSSNASNLAAGIYNLTVADVNNCSVTETVTITEPLAPLALTQSQTDLTCYNDSTGSATVNVTGGTTPYTYNWNPSVSAANTASSLAAGTYNVVVLDDHNCTITASFTLTQPTQLTATHTVTDARCFGDANGSVVVTATGGAGTPYTYSWNPAVNTSDTAQNLSANTYSYTVTDNTGCTVSNSATVTQPTDLVLSAAFTNLTCNNANDGTITASAVGGTASYSYSITNDGVNFNNSTTGLYTALAPGNYVVIVADVNGCVDSTSGTIANPPALGIVLSPIDVVCYGLTNGQIAATLSNATQPVTYVLSNNDQNGSGLFAALPAGAYSVTATDANGCTVTDTTSISEPAEVLVSIQPDSIEINLGALVTLQSSTNQSGALTYMWSPAAGLSCTDCAAPDFSGYSSLAYTLTVTNTAGCTGTASAKVVVKPSYDVFMPNAFSPNGDGANDIWKVYGNMPGIKQLSVQVFNRIGEKVFESNDINSGWDGYYKGVLSPPGVYVYVAKFVWLDNHTDSERTGTITLLK